MSEDNYRVNPVGFVRAGREGFRIEIDPAYRQALAGLEGFSHVLVLWWANLADGEEESSLLSCESPYRNGPQQMGIFSTRSPLRPNPICLSCTGLLSVEQKNGVLNLAYIDAEDGTPVLDIKPYHPSADRVRTAQVPLWCRHWPQSYEDSADFDWEAEFINAC